MRLRLLLIPLVALVVILGVSSSAHAITFPETRTVRVGDGGGGIATNAFFPDAITMRKGDTIHFANPYEEPHTATYVPGTPQPMAVPDLLVGPSFNPVALNPTSANGAVTDFDSHVYYNSGFMFKGQSSDVVFNQTGRFKFLCLFHPGMELTIDIIQDSDDLPAQADLDKKADAERDALIAAGNAIAAGVSQTKVTDASGISTWDVQVGGGKGQVDVMQFLPVGPLKINAGDTVRWTVPTFTPHTVTFGNAPDIVTDTGFGPGALPSGGSTYSGGDANSGVMDKAGDLPGGSTYSLMFTKAGTYTYVCLLHADQGMASTIIVSGGRPAPPTQPIKSPNTGTGGATDAGSWIPSLLILAVAGAGLLAAGARGAGKRET